MSAGLAADRLCLVSDRRRLCAAAGAPLTEGAALLVEQAAAAGAAGIGAFQLREPDLAAADLLALARAIVLVLGPTRLLVNDRADVAAAAGAGVHLRERSLPAARVRAALAGVAPIWRAVHDVAGVAAAGPVDALVAGTVSVSVSKPATASLLGVDGLAAIVAAATVPVYAIGGLRGRVWPTVAPSGAAGCAAIGAFLPLAGERIAAAMTRAVEEFRRGVDCD
ncbi:MAG: thiamine phosphate synthase [Vicinamibacterales bacterium]